MATFLLSFPLVKCMASCSKQGTHAIQDQILQNSVVSDQLWKILADTLYEVACQKDTQYLLTGKYWDFSFHGTYYIV